MKSVLISIFVLLSSSLVFATPQDFTVSQIMRSESLNLQSAELTLTNFKFDPSQPLNSFAELEISGTYDAGYCWIDGIAMQKSFDYGAPRPDIRMNLSLVGFSNAKSGRLSALSSACAGGSAGNFTIPLEVKINSWGHDQVVQNYQITITTTKSDFVVLLTFDKNTGWLLNTH